jgi:hypothetical protein
MESPEEVADSATAWKVMRIIRSGASFMVGDLVDTSNGAIFLTF